MGEIQQIDDFYESYIDFINELFPPLPEGHVEATEGATEMIDQAFGITCPGLSPSEIAELRSHDDRLPESLLYFWSCCAYGNLELPIFSFPSTRDGVPALREFAFRADLAGCECAAFAYDKSDEHGVYSIGLQGNHEVQFTSFIENRRGTLPPLASSLGDLLEFIKTYIEWGGDLRQLDEDDRTEALQELQAIDSNGIGGAAWTLWWLPRLMSGE